MHLFKKVLKWQGFDIKKAQSTLHEIQRLPPLKFKDWQEARMKEIFDFHYEHNYAYRQLVGDCSDISWQDIPVMTKSDLQIKLEDRLSGNYKKDDLYINNTSGSTGQPFNFAKNKSAHAMTWAIIMQRFGWHNINYGKDLQARFYGIPLSGKKYWLEQMKDQFSARIRFPIFDMSDETLLKYTNQFSRTNFVYINGYTSSLVLYANYLIDNNIVLQQNCPSLKMCFTTAETCSPDDRKRMEKAFGVPVVNEYGAAELGVIAFEDNNFDWVVSDEDFFVEVVDQENQPVPNGESGKLIITSLHNRAMPFIRYEVGDIGSISKNKKGIHKILTKLEGRTNDVAILPSGKKSPGLTFYYISKKLLEMGGIMKEFIIKQCDPKHFHFEYIADRELMEKEKESVRKAMDQYLEIGLYATFERKERIERTQAGKLRHFQRLF